MNTLAEFKPMKTRSLLPILCSAMLLLFGALSHAEEAEPAEAAEAGSKEVSICSAASCVAAEQIYSPEQLFAQIEQLLSLNASEKITMCTADTQTRSCKSPKVCHFVLGGIIPGNGCSKSLTFSEVEKTEQAKQLAMKAHMPLTFIGTPLRCNIAASTLSIGSVNDISLQIKPHFCSWMLVGAMTAKLDFTVESINRERGEIAGYWQHSVRGTGNGSGSGYLLLKFPKNIVW